jgi:two-component system LytT family response regulator
VRKWRVVVADDEPAARRGVRQQLASFEDFGIVGEARDGRELFAAMSSLDPDLLFLDIQMPGIDGLTAARRIEGRPLIVFLTAYDQFAVEAFDVDAVDYLVKPVSDARFAAAIRRVTGRLTAVAEDPRLHALTAKGTTILRVREIDWLESADYYVRAWVGDRSYLVRESLSRLERRLIRHGFQRAHRTALVSVAAVRALRAQPSGELVAVLDSGAKVPISRRRRRAFVQRVRLG